MSGKTATIPSILPIPRKIEEMLRSEDEEMIKLGAMYIQCTYHENTWRDYLLLLSVNFWASIEKNKEGNQEIVINRMLNFNGYTSSTSAWVYAGTPHTVGTGTISYNTNTATTLIYSGTNWQQLTTTNINQTK